MKKLFMLSFAMMAISLSAQPLLLEENFNYAVGDLEGLGSWAVSTNSSGGTIIPQVQDYQLSYGSYISSGLGKVVFLDGSINADRISYKNTTNVNSGSYYMAFLVKITSIANANRDFIGLDAGGTGNMARCRIFSKQGSDNTKVQFYLTKNATPSTTTCPQLNVSDTHLLVLRYTFVDGTQNDDIRLYIDPDPGTVESANTVYINPEDATTDDIATIKGIFLKQRAGLSGTQVGGIRVATTWEEAVKSAAPLAVSSISITEGAEVVYSALTEAVVTFNKPITKGAGTITLFDGSTSENISLDNVTVAGTAATIPLTVLADKSYTLTVPAGAFVADAESSAEIVRHFSTIASLANVDYLINETFDTGALSSVNWDETASTASCNTLNLMYESGYAASLTAGKVLQTVALSGAGSLVYWQRHSSGTNTTLDLKISVDEGNTGTFTEITEAKVEKPTNTTFAQKKVDIDYNGPVVIKIEADGTGATQMGLDNITLTPYKANKAPVIEDVYTSPRFPSASDNVIITAKITDTDIVSVVAKWGTTQALSETPVVLTLDGGVYKSTPVSGLSAGDMLYYQIEVTDASSLILSNVYKTPVCKAYTSVESFNSGFDALATSTSGIPSMPVEITSAGISYSFTGATRTTNAAKIIEGTSIVLEKQASDGAIKVSFPAIGSINFDVLQTSGTVSLGVYKEDDSNLLKTISIAGTPWPINTGDIELNSSSATKIVIKNLGSGQVVVDNLRWEALITTSVEEISNSAIPVSEQYYTITGILVSPSATGMLFKKTVYDNGAVETVKIFRK